MNRDRYARYARTLEEAFGPHTSQRIETEPEPIHPHDRVIAVLGWLP